MSIFLIFLNSDIFMTLILPATSILVCREITCLGDTNCILCQKSLILSEISKTNFSLFTFYFVRTVFFLENIRKRIFPPKMIESKSEWYHQKVLGKSFPMNGHVSRFRQILIFGGIFCVPPLATEVTNQSLRS
jgi:hypothetical protein